jgi:hypothetical protein
VFLDGGRGPVRDKGENARPSFKGIPEIGDQLIKTGIWCGPLYKQMKLLVEPGEAFVAIILNHHFHIL